MIYGIGTDLCDVRRIEQVLARHGERFVQRVLGPQEQRTYAARNARLARRGAAFVATRFAAKEAFSKAIGLGMRMPMTWRDCEIVNAASGKPELRLHGELERWFRSRGLRGHVSVSDEAEYASAFVVIEQERAP